MTETKLETQYRDNGDDTVTDLKNDIMWLKSDTWVTLGRLVTWHESQAMAIKMNEEKFAGYNNWRIPSASEVKHLFHISASNTDVEGCEIHIDPVFTSQCGFTTWTSQTRGAKAAMAYDLRSDFEFWLAKENDGFPSAVRFVRDNIQEEEDPDFVRVEVNKNGTIIDNKTGLMWKAVDSFIELDKWVSWDEAKTYVKNMNRVQYCGYRNWRMPTRKEAQSIYDPSSPVTDNYGDTVFLLKGFPAGCGQTCWTKTLNKSDKGLAIRFHFYNGDYKWHGIGLRSHGVRAVRSIEEDS